MIRIFTDTSANLPAEAIAENHLTLLPFRYTLNGQVCSALADFDGATYYQAMRDGAEIHTSMIHPHDFTESFSAALAAGDDVIYVGMSGGISGTFQSARSAVEALRATFPERKIEAIDTCAASLGEGFAALHAARLAAAGADFESIVDQVRYGCQTMCQFFTVDTLSYLRRSGRISGARAVVGNLLNIKPILLGDETGHIVLDRKVRGRRTAIEALADEYDRRVADRSATIGIAHADCPEDAALLSDLLADRGLTGSVVTVCYEPVTGAHVGPGALALFFYAAEPHHMS